MATPLDFMSALSGLAGGTPSPAGPPPGLPATPPNPEQEHLAKLGLAALDDMANRDTQNGAVAIQQIKRALDLAQRLIAATLPQISSRGLNPQVYKDLHVIGRQIADARLNLEKEPELGAPPEALLMGLSGTGLPSTLPTR